VLDLARDRRGELGIPFPLDEVQREVPSSTSTAASMPGRY
jgi:hypothetical protein